MGHSGLLLQRAVVLYRKDHRIRRSNKGISIDRLDDGVEGDLCGESVSVVDHGKAVVTVPAVQLHAPAAGQQNLAVELDGRLSLQLVSREIRVVGGGYVVSRHRSTHITFIRNFAFIHKGVIIFVH